MVSAFTEKSPLQSMNPDHVVVWALYINSILDDRFTRLINMSFEPIYIKS